MAKPLNARTSVSFRPSLTYLDPTLSALTDVQGATMRSTRKPHHYLLTSPILNLIVVSIFYFIFLVWLSASSSLSSSSSWFIRIILFYSTFPLLCYFRKIFVCVLMKVIFACDLSIMWRVSLMLKGEMISCLKKFVILIVIKVSYFHRDYFKVTHLTLTFSGPVC